MTENTDSDGSREARLNEIIAEYLRLEASGNAPDRESLLAQHEEFRAELKDFFEDESRVAGIVAPPADASAGPWTANIDPPEHDDGDGDGIERTIDSAGHPAAVTADTVDIGTHPLMAGDRYKLIDFHARGGMGEVWLAEDARIGRQVAVKRLRAARENQQDRFQTEAQITGQLEHPGIVRVYDLEIDEQGGSYYVMQFVRGKTLKEAIAEFFAKNDTTQSDGSTDQAGQSETREVEFYRLIEVFLDLCQTVGYAHNRGVLHRDLKPDNVMLGEFGETLVLDWGLSKVKGQAEGAHTMDYVRTSGGTSATQAGSVMGSPTYMSPEAAAGRIHEVDEASDIFLLGATLYEILTNRPPRSGSSLQELIELARSAQPVPPRSINKSVPRPLESICAKAMAHRKADRYASAMDLATDVRRFLAGEPVSAYHESLLERLARWARRHRRGIAYAAAAMAMLGLGLFAVLQWRARGRLEEYDRALTQVEDFRAAADEAHFLVAGTDPKSEQLLYYDVEPGIYSAERALRVAEGWGDDFALLLLAPDKSAMKQQLSQEVYALLLLLAQSRLQVSQDPRDAQEVLSLLERGRELHEPTPTYFRLRRECNTRLLRQQEADQDGRWLDDPRIQNTALDHFLQGELYRRLTWDTSPAFSTADRSKTYQEYLESAVEEFQWAIRRQPDHYWAHLQLGRCYMALGRFAEAVGALNTCVALRKETPWAYAVRGFASALMGNQEAALQELDALIDREPAFAPARLNRGFAQLLDNNTDKALADFDWIMSRPESQPLSAAAFYRSQILEGRGDRTSARRDLDWIIGTDPDFARAYLSRARLLIADNQYQAALRDLDSYLFLTTTNLDRDSWQIDYQRGLLLLDMLVESMPAGDEELRARTQALSRERLERAVADGGDIAELFEKLGGLLERMDDPSAAARVYDHGLSVAESATALHIMRGWLRVNMGDPATAKEDFEAVLTAEPDNLEALSGLAYVQASAGDRAAETGIETVLDRLLGTLRPEGEKYVMIYTAACVFGKLSSSAGPDRVKHERRAIELLTQATDLWRRDGSPADLSIPDFLELDLEDAFRSLRSHVEFQQLLRDARMKRTD